MISTEIYTFPPFQGSTEVITLPPVSLQSLFFYFLICLQNFDLIFAFLLPNPPQVFGLFTQSALFNLTVWGYRGDSLVFNHTTALPFSPRNASSFIQTDRARYQRGDTVKVRVASLRLDQLPHAGRVDTSVLVGVCPVKQRPRNGREFKTPFVMADALLSRAGSQRGSRRSTGVHREHGDCAVGILFIPHGTFGTVDDHSFSQRTVEI